MDLRSLTLLAFAATLGCVERVGAEPDGETSGDSDGVDETGTDGSSSDSEAESTESDSDPTTGFAGYPDLPRGLDECDPFLQNCPDGDKCVPYGDGDEWLGHRCMFVNGNQAAGEACEWAAMVLPLDNCDDTSMCWNLVMADVGWAGTCVPFCTGTPEAPICPRGMTCMMSRDIPVWCE